MTPFDFVKAISQTKQQLITDSLTEKQYVPFIVNQALSYFPDTILYANMMNINCHIDNKLQFDYLSTSIRKKTRYAKWHKKDKQSDIDLIIDFYKYSRQKAAIALQVLTPEQLDNIRSTADRGGASSPKKSSVTSVAKAK